MAIGFGSAAAVNSNLTANGTTNSLSIPSSVEGWLPQFYLNVDPDKALVLAGWTDRSHGVVGGDGDTLGCIHKSAASETSPIAYGVSSGSSQSAGVSRCFTGVDLTDPLNSNNTTSGLTASVSTFALASGVLTLSSTAAWAFLIFGTGSAVRTISTPDGTWPTLASNANTTVSDHSIHVLIYQGGATSTPAVSVVMSGSRQYAWMMGEIKPAAGAGGSKYYGALALHGVG